MVTAKGEESDVVLGLGSAPTTTSPSPSARKELLARVKAVLRRGPLREERGGGERIVRDGLVDRRRAATR